MMFSHNELNSDMQSSHETFFLTSADSAVADVPSNLSCTPILKSSSVGRERRYPLSILAIMAAVLISFFDICHCFSPGIPSRWTRQLTCMHVIETESPSATQCPNNRYQPFFAVPTGNIVNSAKDQDENDTESTDETSSEMVAEDGQEQYSESEDDEKASRIERAAKAAELLSKRTRGPQRKINTGKSTSVGARRVGSASKSRGGVGSMTRLTDAVRRSAGASAAQRNKKDENDDGGSSRFTQAAIQTTVNDMINKSSRSMGILGEAGPGNNPIDLNEIQTNPPPGTVLVDCQNDSSRWQAVDRVSIRTATLNDDLDIANLRLSVFSKFSANMRESFMSRSCHVLATRRNQGATCIVATVPRYGSILSSRKEIILGTAECSIHEFYGTRLGSCRRQNKVLYITEVAVSPTARKKGIGGKIMRSIDDLAKIRGVETLYLHVDVGNYKALNLYERAGFERTPAENQIFQDFTRSLNLHDGAMKGKNHYLMYKDILSPTWLPGQNENQRGALGIEVTTFE